MAPANAKPQGSGRGFPPIAQPTIVPRFSQKDVRVHSKPQGHIAGSTAQTFDEAGQARKYALRLATRHNLPFLDFITHGKLHSRRRA